MHEKTMETSQETAQVASPEKVKNEEKVMEEKGATLAGQKRKSPSKKSIMDALEMKAR